MSEVQNKAHIMHTESSINNSNNARSRRVNEREKKIHLHILVVKNALRLVVKS